ncbi:hypothetical protein AHAS_Ahas02G0143700 [Arachis hypogaea]
MILSQKIHEAFKGTVERIMSARTISAYKEKKILTVSEFVIAADKLIAKCPTGSWELGEPNQKKPYLLADKQFLITRNDKSQAWDVFICRTSSLFLLSSV